MKIKMKKLSLALMLSGVSMAAFASSSTDATITQINQEMQAMQKQMQALRAQVKTLKAKERGQQKRQYAQASPKKATVHTVAVPESEKSHSVRSKVLGMPPGYMPFGNSVILAPSTGTPSHYDGSSFIINAPSVNNNIYVLERTADALNYYKSQTGTLPKLPRLVLSGDITGIGQYTNTYQGHYNSDIDLTGADLDMQAVLTPMVTGLMEFSYDNSAATESARRISNSQIKLNQGYLTIGDLNRAPIFGSLGQFYAPFGRYSSIMISSPLTEFLGRTKARAFEVGYRSRHANRPYAEAFIYRGASSQSSETKVNNGGIDFGYKAHVGQFDGNLGASFVRNIGDADGMQDTGSSSGFTGFAQNSSTEDFAHAVPGGDIHLNASYNKFTLFGEYVAALQRFASQDMTYNGRGARPSAYTFEGLYSFNMFHIPSTFGLSYGRSYQALGFNIPSERMMVALQMAVRRYTLLTLEFRHDKNYSAGDTATSVVSGSTVNAYVANDRGKDDNTVTAQLGIYF